MVEQPNPRGNGPSDSSSISSPDKHHRVRLIRLLIIPAAAILATVILLALRSDSSGDAEIVVGQKVHTIQMDVLNSVGHSNLAQQMTQYLRSQGFDVVEIGNYREELEKTLVIDRTGNSQAAVQVAKAIGVPLEQVMQKIDKTLYLDVSVYIGKDYQSLEPFR